MDVVGLQIPGWGGWDRPGKEEESHWLQTQFNLSVPLHRGVCVCVCVEVQ